MKTYNTIEEVKADIKDGVLAVNESVTFNFSLTIEANLKIAGDINAGDIQFYAVAFAYTSFACKSIMSRREPSKFFCLDSEVKFK